jgi:long-chain acyl-CoA synthetase
MGDIEKYGIEIQYSNVDTKPEDFLTIIYTSGSSGFPKGAILSEKAFRNILSRKWLSPDYIHFSYQPLAWTSDRKTLILTFLRGGRTAFSTGDPSRLMEELALVRPSYFAAAPTIWSKIYTEFNTALILITT